MKKTILASVILLSISSLAYSHSGRTDQNGGHNCSQKSVNKGLCSGYHYHTYGTPKAQSVSNKHEHNGTKHAHSERKAVTT
jgi:hypothetical protein